MSEENSELDVGGKEDIIVYTGSDLLKRTMKKRKKRSHLSLYQSKQAVTKEIKAMRRRSSRRTLQMITLHENSSTSAYSDNETNGVSIGKENTDNTMKDKTNVSEHSAENVFDLDSESVDNISRPQMSELNFDATAKEIYVESCWNTLVHTDVLQNFLKILNEHDCLTDLMLFFQLIVSGKMAVLNIPLLLLLDLAKFKSCRTTTQMRYRIYTRQFWEAVYRFGGGTMIRLFSGLKNFGQLCAKKCKKSLYDPLLGDVTFAVPDVKLLAKSVGQFKSRMKCGFIEEAIALLDRNKEYNMSIDGKKISPGLSEEEGDIYLFGLEGPPNLEERQKELKIQLNSVQSIISSEENNECRLQTDCKQIEDTILMCSERVKKQRLTNVKQEKLKVTFQKAMQKDPSTLFKYNNAISSIEMFQILSEDLMKRILHQNKNLCSILSMIRGNYQNFIHGDFVNIQHQGNCMTLYEPGQIDVDQDEELMPQYVKQGTEEWLKRRKLAVITSSTANAALGFDTRKRQKEIFNERVLGHDAPAVSNEMQRMFDHGKLNEIHSFATLAAVILPAFFDNNKLLAEIGCLYLDGDNREKLVVVSPDGFITDATSVNETYQSNGIVEDMSVEIKSPMGENKLTTPVHYVIPKYYVPQVLLQMRVLDVKKGLYISKCTTSIAVLVVTFDQELWSELWKITKVMYDKVSLKKLVKCAKESKKVQELISKFTNTNCRLLCEVPVCTGTAGEYKTGMSSTPFRKPSQRTREETRLGDIKLQLVDICKAIVTLLNESYEMERQKATELLMIVLNDTDRIFDPDSFYALPIAFLLKGYSLDVRTMREIIDIVLNRLKKEGVKVVSTSFDGQWTNVAVKKKDGMPLTKLQLQKFVWNKLGRISKDNLLRRLKEWTSVQSNDLEECSNSQFITVGQRTFGNLGVDFQANAQGKKYITAYCLNGECEYNNVMTRVCTPQPHMRPDLWIEECINNDDNDSKDSNIMKLTTASNVLTLLPKQFLESSTMQSAIQDVTRMSEDEDWLPDIPSEQAIAQNYDYTLQGDEMGFRLINIHPHFLQQILVGLCSERRGHLWTEMEITDFYNSYLKNQKQIEKLTSYEMDVVDNVFFSYKGKHLFRRNDLKSHKVKVLCKFFARKRHIHRDIPVNTKKITLRKLCEEYIRDIEYPTNVLAVAMVNPFHTEARRVWYQNATVPMRIGLPKSETVHECYCYPEFDNARNQIECKMLDPTHILTNIRTHICTRGYAKIKRSAFLRVSETDNNVLNRAYIVNILDKQSAAIAMKFFSIDVQRILMMNNDTEEADFVGLVRRWYEAVDERGIPVVERVSRMQDMFEYLCEMKNFDEYPPPTRYVAGMPIVTYESLLHNITTRIQLYGVCKGNKYNQRSFSTLDIETEFSKLSRMEGSYNGCPKSTNLGLMMQRMVQMQQLQYNQNKIFSMHVSHKKKYPENDLISSSNDMDTEEDVSEDDYSRIHIMNGCVPMIYSTHTFDR